MKKTALIILILVVVLGGQLLTDLLVGMGPEINDFNADKQVETVPVGGLPSKLVTLKRPFGLHGTKFIARLQVKGENVKLAKAYVDGPTGTNFSIGGHALGYGLSGWSFWMEEEEMYEGSGDTRRLTAKRYAVLTSMKRIHFFIYNEQMTILIGTYELMFPAQIESAVKEVDGHSKKSVSN